MKGATRKRKAESGKRKGTAITLHRGDCARVLSRLGESWADAIVTDPPYALTGASRNGSPRANDPTKPHGRHALQSGGFMGMTWDSRLPTVDDWRVMLSALKPGAFACIFGGTRTYHRLACAVEDAGFEIRDCIMWVYGQGFPKSLDVAKAIDKRNGHWRGRRGKPVASQVIGQHYERTKKGHAICAAAAAAFEGFGTALKPAYEPILLCRKPLDGTVDENVLAHGTGALNIDACRIGTNGETPSADRRRSARKSGKCGSDIHSALNKRAGVAPFNKDVDGYCAPRPGEQLGRWPANIVHDGSEEVLAGFPRSDRGGEPRPLQRHAYANEGVYGDGWGLHVAPGPAGFDFGDRGSAARFFYCAKASRRERGEGNTHPTVKPLALIEWLIRLVCPPGGIVLDPFLGSGTTAVACLHTGHQCVGIERDKKYLAIARRRVAASRKRAGAK